MDGVTLMGKGLLSSWVTGWTWTADVLTEDNASLGEIIRGQFHLDFIALDQGDGVTTHFASDVGPYDNAPASEIR